MLVTNATLTSIDYPDSADDYDAPAARGNLWTGTVECYLEQRTRRVSDGQGGVSYVRDWTVYLDLDDPPVDLTVGLTLTVAQAGAAGSPVQHVAPIMGIEARQQDGMPADVQTRAIAVEPSGAR